MGKSSGKDEAFDGAKFAAEILRRLPAAQRERLTDAIETQDPVAFGKIEERMEALNSPQPVAPSSPTTPVLRQDKVPMVQPTVSHSKVPLENSTAKILTKGSQSMSPDELESLTANRKVETENAQRRAREEVAAEQPARKSFKKPGRYA